MAYAYCLEKLDDDRLIRDFRKAVSKEKTSTAELLAYIAEVDRRGLYLLHGPSRSMHAFCVSRMNLGEHEAYDKIRAARGGPRPRWRVPRASRSRGKGHQRKTLLGPNRVTARRRQRRSRPASGSPCANKLIRPLRLDSP